MPDPEATPTIVEVRDLHYAYPNTVPNDPPKWVLRGLDFRVQAGEFVGILGPAGAGKSTLALALLGVVPQSTGGWIKGEVTACGLNPRIARIADVARQVGLVFQEPESQFLMPSVREEVAFGLESLGLPREQMEQRISRSLHLVGLEGFEDRSPFELSGGQKQRVALAAVLAMRPRLLVLDEPTANLDPAGTADLYAIIDALRHRAGTTILMISNDSQWLAQAADRVLVIDDGRVLLSGPSLPVFRQVASLEAVGLAAPQLIGLCQQLEAELHLGLDFVDLETAAQQIANALPRRSANGR